MEGEKHKVMKLPDVLLICLMSFGGLFPCGISYGWGALIVGINEAFAKAGDDGNSFATNHGVFSGVVFVFFTAAPYTLVKYALAKFPLSDLSLSILGTVMMVLCLSICALSVQYRILSLLYISLVFVGLGGLLTYIPIVFRHQLYFKACGYHSIGSGIFGLIIGVWTVVFFSISIPLSENFRVHEILYIYAGCYVPFLLIPICIIGRDEHSAAARKKEEQARSMEHIENAKQNGGENAIATAAAASYIDERKDDVEVGKQAPVSSIPRHIAMLEKELTFGELLFIPQAWLMYIFIAAIIMPGYGIKLASYKMLDVLFQVSDKYAAEVSAVYVLAYAIGRLVAGVLAQYVGLFLAYDIIIVSTIALLVALPSTVTEMTHVGEESSGCQTFFVLCTVVGFLYGGAQALIYSIPFEIFHASQYKTLTTVTSLGFSTSVIIGGISSAYSFSGGPSGRDALLQSSSWFYAMAGACGLALVLLHCMAPYRRPPERGLVGQSEERERRISMDDYQYSQTPSAQSSGGFVALSQGDQQSDSRVATKT